MPLPSTSAQHRTQEQRSSEMRERLLDATVACLVEYGYAGTTTARVAEIAGVTRGAQVHHFRSKADLVTAAVSHVAASRAAEAVRELGTLPEGLDPIADGLDLIWKMHQGPTFIAAVELWIAARTDPALARQVETVEPAVTSSLEMLAQSIAPPGSSPKQLRDFTFTALDAVRGILISGYSHGVETPAVRERLNQQWQRVRKQLIRLAHTEFGTPPQDPDEDVPAERSR